MDRGAWWATVHGVAKELDTANKKTKPKKEDLTFKMYNTGRYSGINLLKGV